MEKFLKCPVCQEVTRELYKRSNELRKETHDYNWSENMILNITETVCDPYEENGEWVTYIDITAEKKKVKLVNKKELGDCGRECITIQTVCRDILDEVDLAFSSALYSGETKRAALVQKICYDEGEYCPQTKKKLPKNFGDDIWKKEIL
eukprot:UN29753